MNRASRQDVTRSYCKRILTTVKAKREDSCPVGESPSYLRSPHSSPLFYGKHSSYRTVKDQYIMNHMLSPFTHFTPSSGPTPSLAVLDDHSPFTPCKTPADAFVIYRAKLQSESSIFSSLPQFDMSFSHSQSDDFPQDFPVLDRTEVMTPQPLHHIHIREPLLTPEQPKAVVTIPQMAIDMDPEPSDIEKTQQCIAPETPVHVPHLDMGLQPFPTPLSRTVVSPFIANYSIPPVTPICQGPLYLDNPLLRSVTLTPVTPQNDFHGHLFDDDVFMRRDRSIDMDLICEA